MLKSEIRPIQRQWRATLSEEDVNLRSRLMADTFLSDIRLKEGAYCHIFLPITKWNEPNTWLLIHSLWSEYPSINVVVSKSNFSNYSMQNYILRPDTSLSINRYGIPEPVEAEQVDDQQLDMVVMPLLAIDVQGNRVGYGKGFYDRMLDECSPDIRKIGFGFHEQFIDKVTDSKAHDAKLDAFVSEQKTTYFT